MDCAAHNSPEAKAVRELRAFNFYKATTICPCGVRYGDWLDSLTLDELYCYYARYVRSWTKEALRGFATRGECKRQARRYLAFARAVRLGATSGYLNEHGKRRP